MNMKKMTSILPIKSLSVFIVLQMVFSGGIAAAAENKPMAPILHLLLTDKNVVPVPVPVCDDSHLSLCATSSTCTNAGGYWWNNNTCNSMQGGTVTSAGQIWMDRNLGASQVAKSSTDTAAYGDLYQWGRGADGHQLRTSPTTSATSSTDVPGHGSFITTNTSPYDWRVLQNNSLWQGASGTNNPCPSGFRLPTETELGTERGSWSSDDADGAINSPLRLVTGNTRNSDGGICTYEYDPNIVNCDGFLGGDYWSSTVNVLTYYNYEFGAAALGFDNFYGANIYTAQRVSGNSVRCIQD